MWGMWDGDGLVCGVGVDVSVNTAYQHGGWLK